MDDKEEKMITVNEYLEGKVWVLRSMMFHTRLGYSCQENILLIQKKRSISQ